MFGAGERRVGLRKQGGGRPPAATRRQALAQGWDCSFSFLGAVQLFFTPRVPRLNSCLIPIHRSGIWQGARRKKRKRKRDMMLNDTAFPLFFFVCFKHYNRPTITRCTIQHTSIKPIHIYSVFLSSRPLPLGLGGTERPFNVRLLHEKHLPVPLPATSACVPYISLKELLDGKK